MPSSEQPITGTDLLVNIACKTVCYRPATEQGGGRRVFRFMQCCIHCMQCCPKLDSGKVVIKSKITSRAARRRVGEYTREFSWVPKGHNDAPLRRHTSFNILQRSNRIFDRMKLKEMLTRVTIKMENTCRYIEQSIYPAGYLRVLFIFNRYIKGIISSSCLSNLLS